MNLTIRPFEGRDTQALLDCWERALPLDAITLEQLERKVLLDENFERESLMVAEANGVVAGFITAFVLNKPIEKVGHREDTGFITAFGVSPEWRGKGVGRALLAAAEKFFADRGRKIICLAPYTPNYFVPGVDKERYADGLAFLQRHGFAEYSEGIAADALISTFELSPEVHDRERKLADEGIVIRHFERRDLVNYIQFQRDLMPGPWVEDARKYLLEMTHGRFPLEAIWLAIDMNAGPPGEGKIIGFCQNDRDHFGPFGVSDDYQGKGIGTVLLARTLYQMRLTGYHCAWVLWTGERALKGVYGRLGFKLTRRFALVKKEM
ncbi:MAG: GNAT family N-acetyltransferase [Candidatus Sumerlaeaceae bacterium]|nr:GNAT family N-acetyltransferase [Candidatus Sumerlaeaceae bacterium]